MRERKSPRLQSYDYSSPGYYFVTICAKEEDEFGEVEKGKMLLNDCGKAIMQCWGEIPKHYKGTQMYDCVVMPNHVHGIIRVTARHASPLHRNHTLGNIIGSFKSASNKRINEIRCMTGSTVWQRGYHERIIRNDSMFLTVRKYIRANPKRWSEDRQGYSIFPNF